MGNRSKIGRTYWPIMFLACWSTSVEAAPLASSNSLPPIASLAQLYDGTMRPELEVETLSHSEFLYPSGEVSRGSEVNPLPNAEGPFPAIQFADRGHTYDLYDYLADNRVAGLLVLKDGKIALEDYELGAGPDTRWASFSMAKSIASTLLGAAVRDGYIHSLDDPVTQYVPALRGGGYEGVSIRNVLMMASGVRWNETYTDPNSDRRKLLAKLAPHQPGAAMAFMGALPKAGTPGSIWNYNTGETYVLGAIIEAATKKPLTQYLSEKIWSRAGMEQDAGWWTESPGGLTLAGGGLSATLRDYGRFGLIALNGGVIDGQPIVPEGWFEEAGQAHQIGGKTVGYGYMWWIPDQTDPIHNNAYQAEGIFGQFIYVNPKERLVIVVLSARPKPSDRSRLELDDDAFFAAVAKALHN